MVPLIALSQTVQRQRKIERYLKSVADARSEAPKVDSKDQTTTLKKPSLATAEAKNAEAKLLITIQEDSSQHSWADRSGGSRQTASIGLSKRAAPRLTK